MSWIKNKYNENIKISKSNDGMVIKVQKRNTEPSKRGKKRKLMTIDDDHKAKESIKRAKIMDMQSFINQYFEHACRNWNFNVLLLPHHEFPATYYTLNVLSKVKVIGIQQSKIECFLRNIEGSYHKMNPYHNHYHAADVMFNMNYFLNLIPPSKLNDFDRFIAILAAVCHDVDHDGHNNNYHKVTNSNLSQRYGESVLENHSVAYCFDVISSDPKCDWISDLDNALQRRARTYLTRLILGTDMTKHGEHLKTLERDAFLTQGFTDEEDDDHSDDDQKQEEEKIKFMAAILHGADIANAAKERTLCVEWAKRCIEEFHLQGDDELKAFGKISNPLYARDSNFAQGQINWIKYIFPFVQSMNKVLKVPNLVQHLDQNLKLYELDLESGL
eukprot:997465_1